MASLEDENEAKIAKILKRARLKHRDMPRLIKSLNDDIAAKKQIKDAKQALEESEVGKLITLTEGLEVLARFFQRKKLYTEIRAPIARVIQMPELKPGAVAGDYVAAAIVARIFLLKYYKVWKRDQKEAADA